MSTMQIQGLPGRRESERGKFNLNQLKANFISRDSMEKGKREEITTEKENLSQILHRRGHRHSRNLATNKPVKLKFYEQETEALTGSRKLMWGKLHWKQR